MYKLDLTFFTYNDWYTIKPKQTNKNKQINHFFRRGNLLFSDYQVTYNIRHPLLCFTVFLTMIIIALTCKLFFHWPICFFHCRYHAALGWVLNTKDICGNKKKNRTLIFLWCNGSVIGKKPRTRLQPLGEIICFHIMQNNFGKLWIQIFFPFLVK